MQKCSFFLVVSIHEKIPPSIDFAVTWFALSNGFWNPFLYWLLNAHFRSISHDMITSKVREGRIDGFQWWFLTLEIGLSFEKKIPMKKTLSLLILWKFAARNLFLKKASTLTKEDRSTYLNCHRLQQSVSNHHGNKLLCTDDIWNLFYSAVFSTQTKQSRWI